MLTVDPRTTSTEATRYNAYGHTVSRGDQKVSSRCARMEWVSSGEPVSQAFVTRRSRAPAGRSVGEAVDRPLWTVNRPGESGGSSS
jgi:hypothetical protein